VDARGDIVATNRAYDVEFGGPNANWTPEDEDGRVLPVEEWPRARASRGEAFTMQFTIRRPDGTRRWFEATNRGQGVAADWTGVVVIRDITDRSLRALQERFMAAASHELRTPVAALHGFLQLAARDLGDRAPEVRSRLEQAIAETRLLGDLVAGLFDVTLAQRGRLDIRRDAVDLSDIVDKVVAGIRVLHPDAAVSVNTEDGIVVAGDPLRLRQLALNLVVNAVTHGAGPVDVVLRATDGRARFEVADRGPGLPPAVASRLFDPFVVDGSDHGTGLGLGLYLARQIVEAHDGTISLGPRPDGGLVAAVELPASPRRGRARRRS